MRELIVEARDIIWQFTRTAVHGDIGWCFVAWGNIWWIGILYCGVVSGRFCRPLNSAKIGTFRGLHVRFTAEEPLTAVYERMILAATPPQNVGCERCLFYLADGT